MKKVKMSIKMRSIFTIKDIPYFIGLCLINNLAFYSRSLYIHKTSH